MFATLYRDLDGDGFGNPATATMQACGDPLYVQDNGDCSDTNSAVNPAASEICDGVDNDCDGDGNDEIDADGDRHLLPASLCEGGPLLKDDCDDNNATVHPASVDRCNDVDDDCDAQIDERPSADAACASPAPWRSPSAPTRGLRFRPTGAPSRAATPGLQTVTASPPTAAKRSWARRATAPLATTTAEAERAPTGCVGAARSSPRTSPAATRGAASASPTVSGPSPGDRAAALGAFPSLTGTTPTSPSRACWTSCARTRGADAGCRRAGRSSAAGCRKGTSPPAKTPPSGPPRLGKTRSWSMPAWCA
ncbi:MAG: hypothetical protein IPL19_01605 [Sandaracinaceae bacterium]|nr:hypothetical protein [Sandaracinaceae bacterium]